MAISRKKLVDAVLQALSEASSPLKARQLLRSVAQIAGDHSLTAKDINSVLYGELKGRAVQVADFTWSLGNQTPHPKPQPPSSPQPTRPPTSGGGDTPNCPECGKPLIQRQARRGPNAGGYFWGCTGFREGCRFTRDIGADDGHRGGAAPTPATAIHPVQQPATSSQPNWGDMPRPIIPPPWVPGRQTLPIQGAAAPRVLVEAIAFQPEAPELYRAFTQWQLDLPATGIPPRRTPEEASALATLEQAFKRGRLVPLSPDLEKALARLAGLDAAPDLNRLQVAFRDVALSDRCRAGVTWAFGSNEEEAFYKESLPRLVDDSVLHWMSGQVSIGSLTGDRSNALTQQRVDFLFAHPAQHPCVIEVDGGQHEDSEISDGERDQAIVSAGFRVLRIPAQQAAVGAGPKIADLLGMISTCPGKPEWASRPEAVWVSGCRRAHQLQLALLQALIQGLVGTRKESILLRIDDPGPLNPSVIPLILDDLNQLIADIYGLCGVDAWPAFQRCEQGQQPELAVRFGDGRTDTNEPAPTLTISDFYLPVSFANTLSARSLSGAVPMSPDRPRLQRLLKRFFGFPDFRSGQYEGIARALEGKDALVLLPTGAGKSVMYQMVTLLRPGVCIVVDPILSLIDDQIANLALHGIDRCVQLTSEYGLEERKAFLESPP